MFCCFSGVRKKKKEKSQKQVSQVNNNKQYQEQNKISLVRNNQDLEKSNKTLIKHQGHDQHHNSLLLPHQRDSKIIDPNLKNGKGKDIVQNQQEFKQLKSNQLKSDIVKEGDKQNSLLVKQSILKGSSLVIEKQKGEDYAIENNETNAVELKAHSKTLQLRFYDEGSIIQTPAISTFRYDTFLSHYFGEQQHNDILAEG